MASTSVGTSFSFTYNLIKSASFPPEVRVFTPFCPIPLAQLRFHPGTRHPCGGEVRAPLTVTPFPCFTKNVKSRRSRGRYAIFCKAFSKVYKKFIYPTFLRLAGNMEHFAGRGIAILMARGNAEKFPIVFRAKASDRNEIQRSNPKETSMDKRCFVLGTKVQSFSVGGEERGPVQRRAAAPPTSPPPTQ